MSPEDNQSANQSANRRVSRRRLPSSRNVNKAQVSVTRPRIPDPGNISSHKSPNVPLEGDQGIISPHNSRNVPSRADPGQRIPHRTPTSRS